jgi:hypothetical protein
MMRAIVARKPPRRGDVSGQVTWFVDQLAELEPVRAAMHEQARTSPVVADFVEALDATWRRMLTNVLADHLPDDDRELAIETLLATISGTLAQRLAPARRRRVIRFAIARLGGDGD